jgi:hypothetical protein
VGLSRGQRSLPSSAADFDLVSEGLRAIENCTLLLLSAGNLGALAYYLSLRRFTKRQPGVQGLACTTSLKGKPLLAPLHSLR